MPLADAVAWRRSVAGPLVFTNGVFDLVHPGHVAVIEAARAEGAALCVGINSDASVRGLGKGDARPLVGETARARVIAAMAAVDAVVIFDRPTPLELITALEPDVIVKGGDYTEATVVGADVVRARGGRVAIVPLMAGYSTTGIVERMRDS